MLLLFVLSLTALGVTGSNVCSRGNRACFAHLVYTEKSVQEFIQSGDTVPSDYFFQENCNSITDLVKCIRSYQQICHDPDIIVDTDAALENVVEFCDEESALRKGYRDHISCLNRQDLKNNTCVTSVYKAIDALRFLQTEIEREIDFRCFELHLVGLCLVDIVEDSCGEEAGQVTTDFLNRTKNVFYCSGDDEKFFEELAADLLSSVIEELK